MMTTFYWKPGMGRAHAVSRFVGASVDLKCGYHTAASDGALQWEREIAGRELGYMGFIVDDRSDIGKFNVSVGLCHKCRKLLEKERAHE